MIDVLVGKIEISPGERIEIYLRTVRGQRVVSFETVAGGEPSSESGTKIAVAHLGKLLPLIMGAVVRADDERGRSVVR